MKMMEFTAIHVSGQIQATEALLKFCKDHGDGRTVPLGHIRKCLKCLKKEKIEKAYSEFETVPFGGMGCFNDWWPQQLLPHETEQYASTVFEALCVNWTRWMRLARKDESNK